jgi:membrane protein YqaA with SNARE-associated domain
VFHDVSPLLVLADLYAGSGSAVATLYADGWSAVATLHAEGLSAAAAFPLSVFSSFYETLEGAVKAATGPFGLFIIAVYSFLIAFALPLPSEVVLAPAPSMELGLPVSATLVLIMVVSGIGKAAGSVFAFHIGQEVKQSGPVIRFLRRSRFDVVEWSEKRTVQLARDYGYIGLAIALSVPFFPDTLSIYAFTVLDRDYYRFAAATFAGSVGRLLVTVAAFGGVSAVV